jgi:YidC/Oxa1 family membrane protein insertase
MLITANIFQPLMTVFETVLKAFHSIGVPWGFSIVLLTVCIRAVLIPLTVKQYHSMRALQSLQPQMKAIQQKYKDDKQRQQQEMMRFYKENNVNPFASCLPMVIQFPVLIALYFMLRESLRRAICPGIQRAYQHSYALRHHVSLKVAAGHTTACGNHGGAGFLFIPDLTSKATGLVLVVLIVLYVGTMALSTVMMSAPQMDKNQRRMMMILPLVFVVFVLSFPTGVIVYWITTNLWTIAQQYVIRRRLGPVTPALAAAGGVPAAAGTPGRAVGRASDERFGGAQRDAGRAASVARAKGSNGGAGGGSENGAGAAPTGVAGALAGALRRRKEEAPAAKVTAAPRGRAAPPPSPRKKKKRSGRRR